MKTDKEKIQDLFRQPTEIERLQCELDMLTFERDAYFDAFVRLMVTEAKQQITAINK